MDVVRVHHSNGVSTFMVKGEQDMKNIARNDDHA